MDYAKYLTKAGVPFELQGQAIESFKKAKKDIKGLLWIKIKARLFMARKIAESLPWEAERLIDYKPEWADYDIGEAVNITCNGDNPPWVETPQGGRPFPGQWMNRDPESDEYKQAVSANYWCKGEHPRSTKARIAWYRRNGGEYAACARGMVVDFSEPPRYWKDQGVEVWKSGKAWIIRVKTHLVGNLYWETKVGYEIDNMWSEKSKLQTWYPIPGKPLRAAVTSSSLPQWG